MRPDPQAKDGGGLRGRGGPRRVDVRDLLAGDRELILVYEAAEYRLRLTSNDKLILTK